MQRFHFRLERVLSVKEQRERLAEIQQLQARARLEEARAECTRIEEEMARMAAETVARLRQAAALGTWQARYEQTAVLSEMLAAARRQTEEAEARLREADRQRIQASLEVEALRGLRAREWLNHRREAGRRRQNDLDELGMRRWRARRAEGSFAHPDPREGEGA